MKCPKCQTDNLETRKFCCECGAKLVSRCLECNSENLPGDKFCGECGQILTIASEPTSADLSFDEKINKIQRYLPKGLTEKILTQRDKIEGERKKVTVMFCDMAGFTALAEKLGPEEAYGIMDQVYEILIHKVHNYGGTVNEMTGDGIMALFGSPIALEDAPQRAIRSAYSIHREMARFNESIKEKKESALAIRMRVGINTGPVVVGTLGNDLRVEFKAVGDTVNLASRMEGLADPGTTYVTEDTFKLAEGFFRFEALGKREVKGKKESIGVYKVIAPSTRRTRFDVSAERGLTPFIGRAREVDLLLDAFARAKAGRGQAISIMSEAGVGKSRLLYEFRKAVANEDITFLEGKCLSYSQGAAYHPIIDILKSNFNILESDGYADIREKVKKGLTILGADEASSIPYLLELLSVKDSGIDQIRMTPEGIKDQINEALKRIVLKGSEIRPLVMAFEDLHWADNSTESVLKYTIESIPGSRVLLVFTYRPEFVHTWGAKSYHNQITLNRLSNRESLVMVSHLLSTENIDRNLEDLVLEKAEGVPFFIEEFIRSLSDLKIIEKKDNSCAFAKGVEGVKIPSTIQDVIMARVDSLPEGAKELLQTGSVIGREFSHQLIKRVVALSEKELLSHISALKDSELIYERGIYPQTTYIIKHAVTQEVVYDSILTSRKKKLHEKIGYILEDLHRENIDEHYSVLAQHFIKSENYENGAKYSRSAGKKAIKAASPDDAINWAEKWVLCIENMPSSDETKIEIIDARTTLAGYFINLSQHAEAKDAVKPIANLALEINYQKRLPIIYTAFGIYRFFHEENFSEGFDNLNEALNISEKTSNFMAMWFAGYNMGIGLSMNCDFENALEYLNKCLELSTLAKNPIGIIFTKGTMCAFNYFFQGKVDLAFQTSEECLRMANNSGDILAKGLAYASHGLSCYSKGLFDKAETKLMKAISFCKNTNNALWSPWASFLLGHLYSDIGKNEEAGEYYARALDVIKRTGLSPSWKNSLEILIAKEKILMGRQKTKPDEIIALYKKVKLKGMQAWLAQLIANLFLKAENSHLPEAENWIKSAIEMHERDAMTWLLGRDYALYAELHKQKGNQSKAKEKMAKAIDILKECGADGWVKKYEEELALFA